MKTLLSLFDYTGNWAEPYEAAGWNVILWDIKHTSDMFQTFSDIDDACTEFFYENIFDNFGTVDGILAAPPCTDIAVSGAHCWKDKDKDGRTERSIEMVLQVLRIVDLCEPDFWALENPVGRLNELVPELKEYGPWYFQPHWWGDPYTKKTGLWGNFNKPIKTNNIGMFSEISKNNLDEVEPIMYTSASGKKGSYQWAKLGGKSEKTKELRSTTPMGFANAFYNADSLLISSPCSIRAVV